MKCRIKWLDHMSFVGESDSGHSVVMDSSPDFGGRDLGVRPMEMLLLGLGIDVATGAAQGQGWGNILSTIAIATYTFMALRRFVGQGRLLVALKMIALLLVYLLSLILTMVVTLAITAATL